MPKQLLHGHDVPAVARKTGGEGVPEHVPGDFGQSRPFQRRLKRALYVIELNPVMGL